MPPLSPSSMQAPEPRYRLQDGLALAAVTAGHVNISVEQRYALADTRAAHEALEARQTTGSTILLP